MAAAGVIEHPLTLPPHLEASEPPEARGVRRDGVRLLVSHAGADRLTHSTFSQLPRWLDPGDVLVVNTSGTLTDVIDLANANVTDCGLGGREVWYRFTIGTRSVVYFDTFGTSFDTTISIRNSCTAAALACEDDDCGFVQDQLAVVLPAGTYFVAVHSYFTTVTTGTINLRWQMISAGNGTYTRITTNGTYPGTTAGTGTLTSTSRPVTSFNVTTSAKAAVEKSTQKPVAAAATLLKSCIVFCSAGKIDAI